MAQEILANDRSVRMSVEFSSIVFVMALLASTRSAGCTPLESHARQARDNRFAGSP
jgi:hypothetical protein